MDLALMSVIAAAGGFTPKVEVSVRDQDYKTNLFFLGIAPAGSGKSVVGKSRLLFTYLKTRFTQLNNGSMRRYKEALDLWELEKKRAAKQHRAKNYDLEPEPYVEREILHPAQTSRSALIKSLADNPNGITIITSELDVLNESLNSDCGKHSAELRCLASNEPIESKYLKEHSSFNQDSPNGGLSATGTIPQFVDFVGNTHDGMLSRCLIMLSTAFPRYLNWAEFDDQQAAEKKQAYYDAAKEVVRIYDFLEKYPTHVTIPPELRVDLDKYLDFYTQRIQEEGYENLRAIINRCQIHVGRIAAILASIRKVEMGYTGIEIKATKEDMDVAIGIVITLLRHACIATTLLIEDGKKTNQIKNIFLQEDIFNSLPVNFNTDAVIKLLMVQFQYSKANTYKIIKRWVEEKFIIRVKKGEYVKTGKPMVSSLK